MTTKREMIDSLRNKLREVNADSTYSNKFLYQTLMEQGKWLVLREASAGRIWVSSSLFKPHPVRLIEVSPINACLSIKVNCKIYRSADKLPEMWEDANGPMLKGVSSVDGSTDFFYTNSTTWLQKTKDPYRKKGNTKYSFFEDGYLWIPEHNPNFVSVLAYYMDDVSLIKQDCIDCDTKDCVRFLDTAFTVPHWVHAELLSKAVELLAGISKKIPEDEEINKNTTRKS